MPKIATAQLRYLKMTPRKVRRVARLLQGLSANEAEAQLALQPRRAAAPLLKLLRSALANAKDGKLDAGRCAVKSIRVDQGPMLKRYLPRARGSASPLQKKMSHVALILEESENGLPAGRQGAPRYRIAVRKKEKKEKKPREKAEKPAAEKTKKEAAFPRKEKQGFMKRFFRRKSV